MERYNVPIRRLPQVLPLSEASEMAKSVRWPHALPKIRPSAVSAGAAMLLHVAVCVVLLTIVRLPVAPKPPDERTVALVFAPAPSVSPEPVAPTAMPDAPVPAEIPAPTEAPVVPPSPSEQLVPAPLQEAIPEQKPIPPAPPPPEPVEQLPTLRPEPEPRPPMKPPIQPPLRHASTTKARVPLEPPAPPRAVPQSPPLASTSTVVPTPKADEARSSPAWLAGVNEWLLAHRSYPEMARRLGQEGAVAVRFTVDRDGRVLNVSLIRSSGSEVLDQAAQAMLHNVRLPPFPPEMLQAQQTVTVSIRYRLDQ